ncbi:prepilin-type N-terminal cleavage/methylation domain-containing protein [bacterium]|nr:prepilin-type N-terminal cleavage/methylation domain-containing protein [bacterium]
MNGTKKENGFTLIELLIASAILTIGLLGMIFLITTVISNNRINNRMTTAAILAQDKLEDYKRSGTASLPAAGTTVNENYNTIAGYPLYRRVSSFSLTDPNSAMKTVTVTVYWDSNVKSVEVKTILYK